MKIYVVNISLLGELDKGFYELTDQEVIDLCKGGKYGEDYSVLSMDELVYGWNNDMIDTESTYIRVIDKKESFPISYLSREDLEEKGFDTSEVDDATMERLASKLGDDYCEQLFWTSLEIIAECMDIPKKDSEDEEEEED